MPQRRERQRTRDSSRDDEPYIIFVRDIPRHCRWQELKDMTRSLGGEQSLKAEVFEVGDGTQMGHCTIKGRSDAMKVYENLCSRGWHGHRVCVQLSAHEKSGGLKTIEGPKESNGIIEPARTATLVPQLLPAAAITTHSVSHHMYPTSAHSSPSMSYGPQYLPVSGWPVTPGLPPTAAMRPSTTPYPLTNSPTYLPPTTLPQPMPPSSHYSTYYQSKSVPISGSSTASPPRILPNGATILLSGLPHDQSETDLRRQLGKYGEVIYLEIHPDSRKPGENKGTARARYKSASDAAYAAHKLNGKPLRDRYTLTVKLEKEEPSMTSTSRKPLIESKNGNSSPSRQKKNTAFTTNSGTKTKWSRDNSRGSYRTSNGSSAPGSATGPLVVNGARTSPTRRGSRGAISESDSDTSSEQDDSDGDSGDEDERVRGVRRSIRRQRI